LAVFLDVVVLLELIALSVLGPSVGALITCDSAVVKENDECEKY
jgi:hypothetical protein